MSVVVVSNRIARAKTDEPATGGLAAALLPMVKQSGATWVGTNVLAADAVQGRECFAEVEPLGNGALATIDLPTRHYRNYYEGFANSALWPALHSRPDLIQVTAEEYVSYREVNACMARGLLRFSDPQTVYWIQDYHFLTLGAEMRHLRVERPIGFFLHTPWAERGTMLAVPHHADLVQAMLAYDLVGFQTEEDQRNFEDYLQVELGLNVVNGTVASDWGVTRLGTFPIGIDFDEFAARATRAVTRPEIARLRASLQGAKLVLGVDRLDYSKGLANRMQAFDRMLAIEPSLKRNVSFLQIAVPTRGGIRAYRQLKSELAALVGEVNGRHGEVDWSPILYLNRGYSQATLAGFYRVRVICSRCCRRMNLVAKDTWRRRTRSIRACWCCLRSPARPSSSTPRCSSTRMTSTAWPARSRPRWRCRWRSGASAGIRWSASSGRRRCKVGSRTFCWRLATRGASRLGPRRSRSCSILPAAPGRSG